MSKQIVVCNKICKSYEVPGNKELTILENVDWQMEEGKLVAICGQSGCGKSTFMNIIGLLDRQSSGSLIIDGTFFNASRDNAQLAAYRANKIGFIFQQHHLLPELTALQNVMVAQLIRGKNSTDARKAAEEILKLLFHQDEIDSGVFSRLPEKMSGGQCQRIAIARALVGNPPLVLADEPTGNLDEHSGKQVFELFLNLQKNLGISVIMVTHNPQQAAMADLTYKIHDRGIVEERRV